MVGKFLRNFHMTCHHHGQNKYLRERHFDEPKKKMDKQKQQHLTYHRAQ